MIKYNIETIDPVFEKQYIEYMMSKCGDDNINLPNSYFHNFRPWECGKVFQYANFSSNDIVLDVGSMNTFFSIFLTQFVNMIYVTDNFYWATREYMKGIATPQEWIDFIKRHGTGKIKVENADIMNLNYKNNTFNKIVCISTIEHVIRDYESIIELVRILKPEGKLLITSEFNEMVGKDYSEVDGSYYKIYNPETLDRLLSYTKNITIETSCIAFPCSETGKFTQIFICIKKDAANV